MTGMERFIANLQAHEGFRALVYDDATGTLLGPGDTIVGNPTIGFGWALNKLPMSRAQATAHLRETAQEVVFEVHHRLPWVKDLDEVRQVALYELGYNRGIAGLLLFRNTLDALRRRRYDDAKRHLLDSTWATQVQIVRRDALAHMIATGEGPAGCRSGWTF